MLKVTDLKVKYGMIEAIKGISFEVRDGEIVTMIGANGAGKTTTMHAISGLVKAAEGSIKLDDVELTKTPANKIVGMGLAQVPEGRRVFAEQTVEENLILGLKLHAQLERQAAGLTRPLQLRSQRFNQDLSSGALLIEVGAAGNSHKEAQIAATQLAYAIVALAKGTNCES